MPDIWDAFAASWAIEDGKVKDVKLYPVDLGQHSSRAQRGWPQLSGSTQTLEKIRALSEKLNTVVRIDNGVGYVEIPE